MLMRRDSLPRFVTSRQFEELREELYAHSEEHTVEDMAAFDAALTPAQTPAKGFEAERRQSKILKNDLALLQGLRKASDHYAHSMITTPTTV